MKNKMNKEYRRVLKVLIKHFKNTDYKIISNEFLKDNNISTDILSTLKEKDYLFYRISNDCYMIMLHDKAYETISSPVEIFLKIIKWFIIYLIPIIVLAFTILNFFFK